MEFKKAIKRIVALSTGASMVGATLFGAMAADLAQYPNQFIKDGKFSGVLVVGDKAAAEDVIGLSDIAVSLQFAATKPVTVTSTGGVTAQGDAWKVGTSTKILEMSEVVAAAAPTSAVVETLRNITTYISGSELKALASGTVKNSKGDAPYNQYLYLLGPGGMPDKTGYVIYAEDSKDVTADFLYFRSGHEIGRYMLEFTTSLQSDVDDSAGSASTTGDYLTDFESTTLKMFGKDYTIVQARRNSAKNGQVKLVLMSGAVSDSMLEGTTKTYTISGKDYEVTLNFVDADSVKFTINGEGTRDMLKGETYKLTDGTTIGVSTILYQSYAGGVHSASFFLGAQKVELKDTNITEANAVSSNALKVGDNTIDDAFVVIEGTDDDSTFKINRIHVNMTADDDFYVPKGGKLSQNPDLTEPEVLFTNNWDIDYRGLKEETMETVELTTSGSTKYVLKFLDGNGNKVTLPLAETPTGSEVDFGETGKRLVNRENLTIEKNDYLILTDNSQKRGERKTYVLQYKGADKVTADSPVIKFKDLGSGETIEQTYSAGSGEDVQQLAILKLGGADHRIYNASSSIRANDFAILVDLDASGALSTVPNETVNLTTKHGLEIGLQNVTKGEPGILVSFKTPDSDRDGSAADTVQTLQATDLVVNVTASSAQVAHSFVDLTTSGQKNTKINLKTPSGETNIAYGYTSYGAFITRKTPSSEPATLKIEYPKKQREALVYVTAKGATFSQEVAGTTNAVTVQKIDVGATKLASEVPDIKAVNSIVVGGPCINTKAQELRGNPAECTQGYEPNVGLIEMFDVGTGNVAMLVAGYSAADTRNAATVVAQYKDYAATLKGSKVEVRKVKNVLTVAAPAEKAKETATTTTTTK
ncbi:hypothetical protein HYX01_00840 [Candidatus Woesearchaeota archaeon]|nr:hypothetical protein [Candidatus Woesearchaeota archaeon]